MQRPIEEIIKALRRHTRLLREYATKAFQEGDEAYLGEVVGKLRLLVSERAGSSPLLIRAMKTLGLGIPIVLGGPPIKRPKGQPGAGDTVTLRQYLSITAYGIRTPTDRWVDLTKADLIHIWTQQHGAAHEDWEVDEAFVAARDSGFFLGGHSALSAELRTTTNTVIHVAEQVLAQVTPQLIEAAETRRRRS